MSNSRLEIWVVQTLGKDAVTVRKSRIYEYFERKADYLASDNSQKLSYASADLNAFNAMISSAREGYDGQNEELFHRLPETDFEVALCWNVANGDLIKMKMSFSAGRESVEEARPLTG
ncbi:MAG: hypothetical protein Q9217_003514 [Psora testacea]